MTFKKGNPALEKMEEKEHKDLDHDGEKGESAAHRKKVLGGKGKSQVKGKEIPSGGLKKSKGKMCGACIKAKKTSCSHM